MCWDGCFDERPEPTRQRGHRRRGDHSGNRPRSRTTTRPAADIPLRHNNIQQPQPTYAGVPVNLTQPGPSGTQHERSPSPLDRRPIHDGHLGSLGELTKKMGPNLIPVPTEVATRRAKQFKESASVFPIESFSVNDFEELELEMLHGGFAQCLSDCKPVYMCGSRMPRMKSVIAKAMSMCPGSSLEREKDIVITDTMIINLNVLAANLLRPFQGKNVANYLGLPGVTSLNAYQKAVKIAYDKDRLAAIDAHSNRVANGLFIGFPIPGVLAYAAAQATGDQSSVKAGRCRAKHVEY